MHGPLLSTLIAIRIKNRFQHSFGYPAPAPRRFNRVLISPGSFFLYRNALHTFLGFPLFCVYRMRSSVLAFPPRFASLFLLRQSPFRLFVSWSANHHSPRIWFLPSPDCLSPLVYVSFACLILSQFFFLHPCLTTFTTITLNHVKRE